MRAQAERSGLPCRHSGRQRRCPECGAAFLERDGAGCGRGCHGSGEGNGRCRVRRVRCGRQNGCGRDLFDRLNPVVEKEGTDGDRLGVGGPAARREEPGHQSGNTVQKRGLREGHAARTRRSGDIAERQRPVPGGSRQRQGHVIAVARRQTRVCGHDVPIRGPRRLRGKDYGAIGIANAATKHVRRGGAGIEAKLVIVLPQPDVSKRGGHSEIVTGYRNAGEIAARQIDSAIQVGDRCPPGECPGVCIDRQIRVVRSNCRAGSGKALCESRAQPVAVGKGARDRGGETQRRSVQQSAAAQVRRVPCVRGVEGVDARGQSGHGEVRGAACQAGGSQHCGAVPECDDAGGIRWRDRGSQRDSLADGGRVERGVQGEDRRSLGNALREGGRGAEQITGVP